MKTLNSIRLKPNPVGKDKAKTGSATPAQLGAEWVDIKNVGTASVAMPGVKVYHVAYPADPRGKRKWELVVTFVAGTLAPGKVVRVHSGEVRDLSVLQAEDRRGADHHIFTGRDRYVWNNAEGDTSRITEPAGTGEVDTDEASYDPDPPEGVTLVRSGRKLVPSS